MNKREAKLRGLKIIHHHLYKMNIEGTLENSVDDDTFDCEMEQIGDEMRFFIYQLEQRIARLESRRTLHAPDAFAAGSAFKRARGILSDEVIAARIERW